MTNNFFWICGKHSVLSALKQKKRLVKKIVCTKKEGFLDELKAKYEIKDKSFFNNKFTNLAHQNIAAFVSTLNLEEFNKKTKLNSFLNIVIIENITDTKNIGNILRSCCLFGIDMVLFNKRTFKQDSTAMIKSASGAVDALNIMQCSNILNAIRILKNNNFWVTAIDMSAQENLKTFKWSQKNVIILGSENKGIKSNTLKNSDYIIKINTKQTAIDSLNISNVAAITLSSLYNFIN